MDKQHIHGLWRSVNSSIVWREYKWLLAAVMWTNKSVICNAELFFMNMIKCWVGIAWMLTYTPGWHWLFINVANSVSLVLITYSFKQQISKPLRLLLLSWSISVFKQFLWDADDGDTVETRQTTQWWDSDWYYWSVQIRKEKFKSIIKIILCIQYISSKYCLYNALETYSSCIINSFMLSRRFVFSNMRTVCIKWKWMCL